MLRRRWRLLGATGCLLRVHQYKHSIFHVSLGFSWAEFWCFIGSIEQWNVTALYVPNGRTVTRLPQEPSPWRCPRFVPQVSYILAALWAWKMKPNVTQVLHPDCISLKLLWPVSWTPLAGAKERSQLLEVACHAFTVIHTWLLYPHFSAVVDKWIKELRVDFD